MSDRVSRASHPLPADQDAASLSSGRTAGGSFTTRGVDVLWPKKAAEILLRTGPLTESVISAVVDHLAGHFPPA